MKKERLGSSISNLDWPLRSHNITKTQQQPSEIKTCSALVNWIVTTNQSFNCLENKDFQELMRHLKYTLSFKGDTTAKSKIHETYETRKQIMKTSITTVQQFHFHSMSGQARIALLSWLSLDIGSMTTSSTMKRYWTF